MPIRLPTAPLETNSRFVKQEWNNKVRQILLDLQNGSGLFDVAYATAFIPTGSTVPTNGMYLPSTNNVGFATNSTLAILIDENQDVFIGTSTDSTLTHKLHLFSSSARCLTLTSSLTDATQKTGRISVGHYTNSEEEWVIIGGTSLSSSNTVQIGGGSGTLNTATKIGFYTAADNVTVTGTERGSFNSDGTFTVLYGVENPPNSIGNSGTAFTINFVDGDIQTLTMTGNVASGGWTLSNPIDGQRFVLFITQDATGGRTLGWPTSFKWPAGAAGTITSTANAVSMLTGVYRSSTGFYYVTLDTNMS